MFKKDRKDQFRACLIKLTFLQTAFDLDLGNDETRGNDILFYKM